MFANRIVKLTLVGLTAIVMAGCATHHDRKSNNTMMGAGLGAAAGAVASQGNPWYALGGAAAGGILGNILTDDDDRKSRGWDKNKRSRSHAKHRGNRHSHDRRGRGHR